MAFTVTNRGFADSGNTAQATIALSAFTPTANSILLFFGFAENDSGSDVNPTAATPSGGSLTWTLVRKMDGVTAISTAGGFEKTLGLWRADVGGSPVSTTITWDGSSTNNAYYTAGCIEVTGHNVATPEVQSAVDGADTGGAVGVVPETVTLGSALTTGNLAVVAFGASSEGAQAITAPTVGGQAMTVGHNNSPNQYEQHGFWYRIVTGAESNAVFTCSDLGATVYATAGVAIEIALASAGAVTGTVAVTLGSFVSAGSGTATPPAVTGTVAVTLGSFTATGVGSFGNDVTGSAAVTLAPFTAAGSGSFTAPSRTGTVAVTLASFTANAVGVNAVGRYPTAVDAGDRFVVDQFGDPWFMVGDAGWDAIVALTAAECTTYLDGLETHGFNTTILSLIENFYSPDPPNNNAGDGPYTGTMFQSATDTAYWAFVDAYVVKAAARGITIVMCPAYIGFAADGVAAEMTAASNAQLLAYGEFLGARYAAFPNIIWMMGGDRTGVDATLKARTDNMAVGIRNFADQLMTAHQADDATADAEWGSYSWLDLNNNYDVSGAPAADAAVAYADTPVRPTFSVEGLYETDRSDATVSGDPLLRYQAWGAICAGAFGHVFGNLPRWHFEGGFPAWNNTWDGSWEDTLNDPSGDLDLGTIHQGVLAGFIASIGGVWSGMAPDTGDTFLTSGEGAGTTRAAARYDADGTTGVLAIAYRPHGGSASLTFDLTEFTAVASVKVRKFDPTDGTYTTVGTYATSGSQAVGTLGTNANGDTDWVIVFEQSDDRTGTVAVTLGSFTSSATGTSTPPAVTGTAAVTLATFVAAGSGTAAGPGVVVGTAAVTLAPFTAVGSGSITVPAITGTVAVTLGSFVAFGSDAPLTYQFVYVIRAEARTFRIRAATRTQENP